MLGSQVYHFKPKFGFVESIIEAYAEVFQSFYVNMPHLPVPVSSFEKQKGWTSYSFVILPF